MVRKFVKLALCCLALGASLSVAEVRADPQTGLLCCSPLSACRSYCAQFNVGFFCSPAPAGSPCQSYCVCNR